MLICGGSLSGNGSAAAATRAFGVGLEGAADFLSAAPTIGASAFISLAALNRAVLRGVRSAALFA